MSSLMLVFNTSYFIKRAVLLCSSFLFLCSSTLFAQNSNEKGSINHFEKKCTLKSLILPNQKFQSSNFKINLSTDLYDAGNIYLKNPSFRDIKFKEVKLRFISNVYFSVAYTFSKKYLSLMKEYVEKTATKVSFSNSTTKNKVIMIFTNTDSVE